MANLPFKHLRVLSVHSRYQIRGGEEEVRDAERSLLQKMGHTVDIYEDSNDRLAYLESLRQRRTRFGRLSLTVN